jgi:hypothetical protein
MVACICWRQILSNRLEHQPVKININQEVNKTHFMEVFSEITQPNPVLVVGLYRFDRLQYFFFMLPGHFLISISNSDFTI